MAKSEKNLQTFRAFFENAVAGNTVKHWNAYPEVFLGLGLIIGVNYLFFPKDLGFLTMSPHPMWVLVLIIAIRYPLNNTILCLALITMSYVYFMFQDTAKQLHLSSLNILLDFKVPILFFAIGIFLSDFAQRMRESIRNLQERLEEQEDLNRKILKERKAFQLALKKLEVRVLQQYTNVVTLFDQMLESKEKPIEEIKSRILDVLVDSLGVQHCSFYEVSGDVFVKKESRRQAGEDDVALVPEKDFVFMEALRSKGISHLAQNIMESQYKILKESSVVAAPLLNIEHNVIAIVVVEKLQFQDFTHNFIKLFSTVMEWWEYILMDRQALEILKSKGIIDEPLGVATHNYFRRRYSEAFRNAVVYSIPLVLILFRVYDFQALSPARKLAHLTVLTNLLGESSTDLDLVFQYKDEDTYAVIFPVMTYQDVETMMVPIVEKINALQLTPYKRSKEILEFDLAIADYKIGMTTEQELLDALEQRLGDETKAQAPRREETLKRLQIMEEQERALAQKAAKTKEADTAAELQDPDEAVPDDETPASE